jgi:hypothetical protein
MLDGDLSDGLGRDLDIGPLPVGVEWFSAPQKRVSAEGQYDE